jgi:hypothetical protein
MSFLGAQNSIALGVQGLIHIDTGGGAGGSADYLLAKSLRFRSSASAYLNRTASANISTYTISMWVKRGTLGGDQDFFSYTNSGLNRRLGFDSINRLTFGAQVFRDPAAWYHIVFSCESGGTLRLYVNGVNTSNPSSSLYTILSGTVINLGRNNLNSDAYFDGEMAEVNFVDGQALAPTAFGAYSIYNQWLPIKYAGAYGTNGFYLPFTNTTSTSTLVADSSGNGNNWTPNNISLTAGSTYDSLTDVPTLTSATVANYATGNPLYTNSTALWVPFSMINGNLSWGSAATNANQVGVATMAMSGTNKTYWEVTIGANFPSTNTNLGIALSTTSNISRNEGIFYRNDGSKNINGTASAYGLSYTVGDVIGFAYDAAAGTLVCYKNNVSQGTLYSSGAGLSWVPAAACDNAGAGITYYNAYNFGQQPFVYTAPSGFLPLNTFNI